MSLGSSLNDLAVAKDFLVKRASSWDRTGRNADRLEIEPGAKAALADIKGAGRVSHIWFTIACDDPAYLRKLVLRAYWDAAATPAIETPVGDFFGVGHGYVTNYQCAVLNMSANPGQSKCGGHAAMNCYFSMPFRKGARFEVTNDCEVPVRAFYYYIDYEAHSSLPNEMLYFHAAWRRDNPCAGWTGKGSVWASPQWHERMAGNEGANLDGKNNYLILETQGRGHYVGCNLSIHNLYQGWWGEGDDMIFVDDDTWPPSCHGTGTEDYFCHAWGMQNNAYLYNGTSLFAAQAALSRGDDPNSHDCRGKWTVYRYHIQDPVPFRKRLRVSIEHGHANNRSDDYSSVAYWYLDTPEHKPFAPLPDVKGRLPNS